MASSDLETKAKEAFIDDHFELAIDLYSQAISLNPSDAELFADRSQANFKLCNFTDAVNDANKAIMLNPAMAKAYLRKAKACIELEEYQTAKTALESGSSLAPGDSRFTDLIKECDERIAEEAGELPKQLLDKVTTSVVSPNDVPPAISLSNQKTTVSSTKPKYRHEFYQKPEEVVVTIFAKGIPADKVVVDFGEQILSVTINVPGEEAYSFLPRLFGKINPAKCRYDVMSTKIEIRLAKVDVVQENSLWNRTYDYTIHLLARSVFTIHGRIGHVFGINHVAGVGVTDSRSSDSNYSRRSQSILFMQSSVHPTENSIPRFSSGSLGNKISMSGPITRTNNVSDFHSGSLGNSITASGPTSGKRSAVSFYSGPLVRSTENSGPLPKASKSSMRLWQFHNKSSKSKQKITHLKPNRLTASGPFTGGFMMGGVNVRVPDVTKDVSTELHSHGNSTHGNLSVGSKNRLLNAPQETLGAAALALHYANIIILIEKLVASPHLIGNEARTDLYNMLPASIRVGLRVKLKPCTKSLSSSFYDTALSGKWNQAMLDILDWLAPLAHNMIKWQSERTFEHQNLVSRTNVLLVQTLYFANQEKTEESIIELLVGLNYVWRYAREVNAKSLVECATL